MKTITKHFNWKSLGFKVLHNALVADEDLNTYFEDNFGVALTYQELNDAFMVGYYFFSDVHQVAARNFEDLEALGYVISD